MTPWSRQERNTYKNWTINKGRAGKRKKDSPKALMTQGIRFLKEKGRALMGSCSKPSCHLTWVKTKEGNFGSDTDFWWRNLWSQTWKTKNHDMGLEAPRILKVGFWWRVFWWNGMGRLERLVFKKLTSFWSFLCFLCLPPFLRFFHILKISFSFSVFLLF